MAEERLIDDDENKDRKYRIRKNADGEDELIIIAGEEEEEELPADRFVVPDTDVDDEDAAVMTPEQLAERDRLLQEEKQRRDLYCDTQIERAKTLMEESDYDGAVYNLTLAEEQDPSNGAVSALKLRALTRNFTDFTRLEDSVSTAEAVRDNCSDGQKAELLAVSKPLAELIGRTLREAEGLSSENEQKRGERQIVFLKRRKRAVKFFVCTALPFIVFLILAISFSTVMFAKQDGTNIILTVAFGAVALAFFIATLFTAHALWSAQKNIALNAKNSSTKLGRQYEEKAALLNALNAIYSAFGE